MEGCALDVANGLLDRITILKDARLTSQMVLLSVFVPLRARPTPMWEYIGLGDQSTVADNHLPEESVTEVAWMVLGFASRELAVNDVPPPFSVFELRDDNLRFLREVSVPPSSGGQGAYVEPDSPPLVSGAKFVPRWVTLC